MPDSVKFNGSRQDVLAAVFDGMSQASKAEAVHSLFARTDITRTRVLGAEVLRAFGLPADKALSVVLDMRPRGEVSTLTVRYMVHGDDSMNAVDHVVKTWRVVPADEGAEAGTPAEASRPPVV